MGDIYTMWLAFASALFGAILGSAFGFVGAKLHRDNRTRGMLIADLREIEEHKRRRVQ